MSAGRTTWHARDGAHHDRELVVELLDEHGPAGPYVETVLRDLAQQQRDEGAVRTGFRVLAKKCGIDRDECRRVVEHGASIGLFDDLEVDDDGRRFSCRLSGWGADQTRGRSAWKKADQRSRQTDDETPPLSPSPGDMSTTEGDVSPLRSTTRPNQTIEEPLKNPSAERLCVLLADLVEGNGSKRPVIGKGWRTEARLLLERDGRSVEEAEAVIRWCQADSFWKTNILSMPKLREKFDQLRLKMDESPRRPSNHIGAGPSGLEAEIRQWERWCAENGVTHPQGPQVAWRLSRHGDKVVTVEKVTAMLPDNGEATDAAAA